MGEQRLTSAMVSGKSAGRKVGTVLQVEPLEADISEQEL
jgi:hypothetical protein